MSKSEIVAAIDRVRRGLRLNTDQTHLLADAAERASASSPEFVDIVFDGPPGPESGRFVECEDPQGRGMRAGEWIDRGNGLWALRIPLFPAQADAQRLREALRPFAATHCFDHDTLGADGCERCNECAEIAAARVALEGRGEKP